MTAPLRIDPDIPAAATLIWLHGLGADAANFDDLGCELDIPGLRIVLPQAPERPLTLYGGQVVPAWSDLIGRADGTIDSDVESLDATAATLHALLHNERHGLPIAIGGYSQGGATALYTALTAPEPVACALSLSGYIPAADDLARNTNPEYTPPLFLAHGRADEVVPYRFGEMSRDWLIAQGHQPEWFAGDFGHEITNAEIDAVRSFLTRHLMPPP